MNNLEYRRKVLNSFSVEEWIDLCNKMQSFSTTIPIVALPQISDSTREIGLLETMNPSDSQKAAMATYKSNWDNDILKGSLIGGGIGAGLGGIYGAFRGKSKKDKLKKALIYGLTGGALGGLGGLMYGTYKGGKTGEGYVKHGEKTFKTQKSLNEKITKAKSALEEEKSAKNNNTYSLDRVIKIIEDPLVSNDEKRALFIELNKNIKHFTPDEQVKIREIKISPTLFEMGKKLKNDIGEVVADFYTGSRNFITKTKNKIY